MPAPSVDGHSAHAAAIGAGTIATALTTTQANDIIVVCVYNENANNSAIRTVTGIAATGLMFTKRASQSYVTNPAVSGHTSGVDLEVWYALAASPLAALTITASFSGSTDDGGIVAFGVSGAITATPWDTDASLPLLGPTTEARPTVASGANTSQANDLLIVVSGSVDEVVPTAPTGFALIDGAFTPAGTLAAAIAAYSQAVTTKQSGVSASIDWGSGVGGQSIMIDALTAGGGGGAKGGGGGTISNPFGLPGRRTGQTQGKATPPAKRPPRPIVWIKQPCDPGDTGCPR